MGRSQRLRLTDVLSLNRLVGECRDLGDDAAVWRQRMGEGLCHLVRAQVAIGAELNVARDVPEPDPTTFFDLGWDADRTRQAYLEHVTAGECPEELSLAAAVRARQRSAAQVVTRLRRQLLSDDEWYRSQSFGETWRRCEVDHPMFSMARLAAAGHIHLIALYRAQDGKPFGSREHRLVHLFHRELTPLIGRQLASAGEPSPSALAPRVRQVLDCLLEGDGEKQIAARMQLSPSTINIYVGRIYRHFAVSSRAELMARWVRFSRPPPSDLPQPG